MKKGKKIISCIAIFVILILIITVAITILRFTDSEFRYNFDITFNCAKTHCSYNISKSGADAKKAVLPLPPSTTRAYKHSDTAVTYYSKLTIKEFLDYYITAGYTVQGNLVYTEDYIFIITGVPKETGTLKYNFIDIDLYPE